MATNVEIMNKFAPWQRW